MQSDIELKLNYDAIPLSKRLAMTGTTGMTKNSLQTEMNWGPEINRIDPVTGYTPLMNAAANGSPQSIQTLMDRGAEGDYQDPTKGRTALIVAAKKGKADACDMLMHKGVSISIPDKQGMYPLMWAAKNGFYECVKVLITRGAGVNSVDPNNWTAMHFAAKYGHREIVEYLSDCGASIILKETLEEGKTPLMLAAQYGRRDTVNALVGKGSKVNEVTTRDELTPLILAAKEGHKGTVRALIEKGADTNMADSYGWTPLHFCASWGRRSTAQILIQEGGANVNAMPVKKKSGAGGTTPLIIACKGQQVDMINILLDYGAKPDLNDAASGKNVLAIAAMEGFTTSVIALIEHGVDLDVRDERRMTPLMLAVVGGHAETIRVLLAACADITCLDVEDKSALDHAKEFGREDIYLMAILKSSALGKANIIPWLEMDTPKMIPGSICGGPNVFLNNILYQNDGLYAGLFLREDKLDVHILHNLTMIQTAAARSCLTQPLDAPDLGNKMEEIDEMLLSIFDCKQFAIDHNVSLALMLQSFPESMNIDGTYKYRYFAGSFATGPLALYLENGLSKMLTAFQVTRIINQVFMCCLRNEGRHGDRKYGARSPIFRLRYCPAVMFVFEGVAKFILLLLVVLKIREFDDISTLFPLSGANLDLALQAWTLSSIIYELGHIEEKYWAVCPSIAIDPSALKIRRQISAKTHFVSDIWRFLDFCHLFLLVLWIAWTMLLASPNQAHSILCLIPIPLCINLLKYPGQFHRPFGELILSIFFITRSLGSFAIMFLATGAGFGIAFSGLFRELDIFSSPQETFRTLFNSMNYNYDLADFDNASTQPAPLGSALMVIFIFWTVIILLNTVIAHVCAMYLQTSMNASEAWLLIKAKLVQQFAMTHEKSPMCMLPVPLNMITTALYPIHAIYTWRARLIIDRGVTSCVSFAGTFADWVLRILSIIPGFFIEMVLFFRDPTISDEEKYGALLTLPFECFNCAGALLYKMFCLDPVTVRLLIKTRLSKGRLRISYGDSRDGAECIGVDDNPIELKKEWIDNGGGGRNPSKYAQIAPEQVDGEMKGEFEGEDGLGDQGMIWSKQMGGMVDRTIAKKYEEESLHSGSMNLMGKIAFAGGSSKGDESKDGDDHMSKGSGDFYDHKFGMNSGKNRPEMAKMGISGSSRLPNIGEEFSNASVMDDDLKTVSIMSDLSSAELLQRFPPMETVNNDFVKNAWDGLLSKHERRHVFETVLPDLEDLIEEREMPNMKPLSQPNSRPGTGQGNGRPQSRQSADGGFGGGTKMQMMQIQEDLNIRVDKLYECVEEEGKRRDEQYDELMKLLFEIKGKTDTIRLKKTKPEHFEPLPDYNTQTQTSMDSLNASSSVHEVPFVNGSPAFNASLRAIRSGPPKAIQDVINPE